VPLRRLVTSKKKYDSTLKIMAAQKPLTEKALFRKKVKLRTREVKFRGFSSRNLRSNPYSCSWFHLNSKRKLSKQQEAEEFPHRSAANEKISNIGRKPPTINTATNHQRKQYQQYDPVNRRHIGIHV